MIIVLDDAYREGAQGRFAGHDIRYFPSAITDPGPLSDLLADADVVGFRRVLPFPFEAVAIERARRVQFIHRSGSGADWFDVPRLSDMGVLVAVNSGTNAPSVVEAAVTLTLLCLRRTLDFIDSMRRGEWLRDLPGPEPMMLGGKTVGIIGVGHVGLGVARAMTGLGAKVLGCQRDDAVVLPPGAEWSDFDTIIETADVISLHVPLLPDTLKMIGAREFARMKRGAVLINTARGPVVDEAALIAALESGKLFAAGLDVFEDEPLRPDHPLRHMPNVITTPHVGGAGIEIVGLQVEGTLSNLELFLAGQRPQRLVNPQILKDGRARARHLLEQSGTA